MNRSPLHHLLENLQGKFRLYESTFSQPSASSSDSQLTVIRHGVPRFKDSQPVELTFCLISSSNNAIDGVILHLLVLEDVDVRVCDCFRDGQVSHPVTHHVGITCPDECVDATLHHF